MEAYSAFAQVYDELMDNVPYEDWEAHVSAILKGHGICDGLVLDLGCGTGTLTRLLAARGYDMIGVDNSEDMLAEAMAYPSEGILYLLQDMRAFELYGTVRAVVSLCDSINYMTEEEDLLTVFKLVNNYLDPGGLFIFDMNTLYKYRELLGDRTIAESREECAFIWDNCFDEDQMLNEYALTLFLKEEEDVYRRYCEYHYQRAYTQAQVERLLEAAGLELISVMEAYTDHGPEAESERLLFVAREHTK